jgi:hypothetical protein
MGVFVFPSLLFSKRQNCPAVSSSGQQALHDDACEHAPIVDGDEEVVRRAFC